MFIYIYIYGTETSTQRYRDTPITNKILYITDHVILMLEHILNYPEKEMQTICACSSHCTLCNNTLAC
jgi:hypothetical protein